MRFPGLLRLLVATAIAANAIEQQVLQDPLGSLNQHHTTVPGFDRTLNRDGPASSTAVFNSGLASLSYSDFTVLTHGAFPHHSVRVKKSDFCDGTVAAYTGYIDIEARHLFFYFFESRSDPQKDDVIFWTNGGPGGSSSIGLFMELGPCRVVNQSSTVFNPYSWNDKANIFFVDQPINVGFSHAEYGETVDNTPDAAKDIAAFVAIFFEHFSSFKGRPFHMAGESFGGRYIPLFAAEIVDQNPRLVEAGLTPINLSSIMIGNGCTDFTAIRTAYYDMQCRPASVPPVLPISTCVRMKQALPRCSRWIQEACIDKFEKFSCTAADLFCEREILAPFFATDLNPYDISKPCDGSLSDTLCYPISKQIEAYLSRPDIRSALGVDASVPANFTTANLEVNAAFWANYDGMFPNQYYIAALLERGVRALIYVGQYDLLCNWVGNERMTLNMEWSGQEEYVAQQLRNWHVGGVAAGVTRSAGLLTFATVNGAGHMAPYDKPVESLELVNRWLAREEL